MTNAIIERNILVKDGDGNWYTIPPSLEQEFTRLKEECISADFGSDEWYAATSEMSDTFGVHAKAD